MREYTLFSVLLIIVLCSSPVYASGTGPYAGIVSVVVETPSVVVDNMSAGMDNLQVANDRKWPQLKNLAPALDVTYHPDFTWNGFGFAPLKSMYIQSANDVHTYLLSGKTTANVESKTIKPFLAGGIGVIRTSPYIKMPNGDLKPTGNAPGAELCLKAGAGVDCYLNQNLFIDLAVDYVRGLTENSNSPYVRMVLGLAYRF